MYAWTDLAKISSHRKRSGCFLLIAALLLVATAGPASASAQDSGFRITASSNAVNIYQGSSGSTTLSVTSPENFSGDVQYTITSPLPSGVTAYFTNDPDNARTILTLTANNSAATGIGTLTIAASSAGSEATATLTLSVGAPTYVLSVSPLPFVMSDGSSATSVATLVPWGNFTGQVNLTAPQLPAGVSVAFSPASTSKTSQLTWTVSDTAPSSSGNTMIYGLSPETFSFALFNQAITTTPAPTFTLGVSPAYLVLQPGSTASDTVTVSELNGFAGNLNLSVTQLPAGVTAEFGPNATSTQSVLTISASAAALPGNYNISVWAYSQDQTQNTLSPLYLTINPRPSFTISALVGPASVVPGQTLSTSIAVTPQTGFTGSVDLSIASDLPPGISASFGENPTRQNTALNISASSSATPGNYFLNINAVSGESSSVITILLTVEAQSITATPTFNVPSGTYGSAQLVSISDTTPSVTIYYSTDGTEPTTNSPVYTGAILIKSSETLQALAVASGYSPSPIASESYTIDIPANPAPTVGSLSPAFIAAGGPAIPVTVTGANFVASSSVMWGNTPLSTQFVSQTELIAQVPAYLLSSVGVANVSVSTPTPGGGTSNGFAFQVDSPSSAMTSPLITPPTQIISAGSTASYSVVLPADISDVSASCLNLPSGASCSYGNGKLLISTASTSPSGTYQITVVITGNQSGESSSGLLLPILLLPVVFTWRRSHRGRWTCVLLVVLALAAMATTGCGGGSGAKPGSSNDSTATTQVTTSASIGLTIQ